MLGPHQKCRRETSLLEQLLTDITQRVCRRATYCDRSAGENPQHFENTGYESLDIITV